MMIKKLSAIGLLAVFFGIPAAAGDRDDNDVFYKFLLYTQKVYLARAMENLDPNDYGLALAGKLFSARVLGYSLSNLLQYARRGSENYQIWLMLEQKSKEGMLEVIDLQGAQERWDRVDIEKSKQNALTQFRGALQNWYDTSLIGLTGVQPEEAPNFFETLATPPPDPPVEPPAPPAEPPVPPAEPPAPPPAPPSRDAVAGTYRVTGQRHYDENPGASFVKLSGSMDEVEAEFKLFSGGQASWDYKGKAAWDGREGDNNRDLKGKTQWLTYPHIFHNLTVRITRGADGVWRAASINIGGNLFQLAQIQSVERPIQTQAKILTIKNTTPFRLSVYLGRSVGEESTHLGSIEPYSDNAFGGLPERGRWYITLDPPPDSNLTYHSFLLYLKEAQYAYFYEVQDDHFR